MKEYIDRQAALEAVARAYGDVAEAEDNIRALPAADVRENVKGKWKCSHGMSHIYGYDRIVTSFESSFTCDCCGWTLNIGTDGNKEVDEIPLNFCPNCGAYMQGAQDDKS